MNPGTMMPNDLSVYRVTTRGAALALPEAYSRAVTAEMKWRTHDEGMKASTDGYRVYHVSRLATSPTTLAAHGDFVVAGRHTQCDLQLPEDPVISLRHVLFRTSILDDGLSLLTVLDLETGVGFELADGSRQRAIVASGPLAVRVGTTWLIGLPRRGELPEMLGQPIIEKSDASPYRVNPNAGALSPKDGARRPSRITIVPASVRLPDPSGFVSAPFKPTDAFEIVLRGQMGLACVRVSERDVGYGVLIGRDPRCIDAGVRAILNEGISRVHCLAIRERDGIRLYDIASTSGLTLPSDPRTKIRSVRLEDGGTEVYLRGMSVVTMNWRAISS